LVRFPFLVTLRNGEQITATSPSQFPELGQIKSVQEPIVNATITTPTQYLGDILQLCQDRRGTQVEVKFIDEKAVLKYILPLNEIVADFYDKLKKTTSGYAALDYEDAGYQESDIVKVAFFFLIRKSIHSFPVPFTDIHVHINYYYFIYIHRLVLYPFCWFLLRRRHYF
jgi:translation elongation factor EF-4